MLMKLKVQRAGIAIVTTMLLQGLISTTVSYARAQPLEAIEPLSLPDGKAGQSYEYQMRTEGGLPPLTWRVVGGELPSGISLEASGKLKGVPSAPRRDAYAFTVEVSDSSPTPQRFAQPFVLIVQAAALRIVINSAPLKIVPPAEVGSVSPLVPRMKIDATGKVQASRRLALAGDQQENKASDSSAPNADQQGESSADGGSLPPDAEAIQTTNKIKAAIAAKEQIDNTDYSWGRVRAYFTGAAIFSKERDDFSKQDLALGFNLDKNYLQKKNFNINTFFDTRLTTIPVSAQDTSAKSSTAPPATNSEKEEDKFATFLASKKAVLMQVGLYLPIGITNWHFREEPNQLFIGPIAKGGIQTITNGFKTAEAKRVGDDNVYNFYSFGLRFGHFKHEKAPPKPPELTDEQQSRLSNLLIQNRQGKLDVQGRRQLGELLRLYARGGGDRISMEEQGELADLLFRDREGTLDEQGRRKLHRLLRTYASDGAVSQDVAPELISYIDITRGRWENFEILKPVLDATGKAKLDPTPTDPTNPLTFRQRRFRWAAEGRLKIPETPFIVGFDGNFGDGPDDL